MSDNGNDNGNENTQQAASVLILAFVAPGSAEFKLEMRNITPIQMLAAAAWLDWFARKQFDSNAAQTAAARPGIIVPGLAGFKPH